MVLKVRISLAITVTKRKCLIKFSHFNLQGIPLHLQIDTYEDLTNPDAEPIHRALCQIKVFRDKVCIDIFKGALSQRFCCFGLTFWLNLYLVVLHMHKMFLIYFEVNIK